VITAAVGMWQIGAEPVLLFVGGTHLAATMFLWGQTMSEPYDGQTAWRERFHMDESAVQRLGRSVIRAGVTLPFILLYALLPRPDAASMIVSLTALFLAAAGLRGLVQLKTWGILALGAAGALVLTMVGADVIAHGIGAIAIRPTIAGVMAIAAAAPFFAPIARFIAIGPA
jgi:hypothetical protein